MAETDWLGEDAKMISDEVNFNCTAKGQVPSGKGRRGKRRKRIVHFEKR